MIFNMVLPKGNKLSWWEKWNAVEHNQYQITGDGMQFSDVDSNTLNPTGSEPKTTYSLAVDDLGNITATVTGSANSRTTGVIFYSNYYYKYCMYDGNNLYPPAEYTVEAMSHLAADIYTSGKAVMFTLPNGSGTWPALSKPLSGDNYNLVIPFISMSLRIAEYTYDFVNGYFYIQGAE